MEALIKFGLVAACAITFFGSLILIARKRKEKGNWLVILLRMLPKKLNND